VKGGVGGGALNFAVLVSAGVAAADGRALGKTVVTYVMILQRVLTGSDAHEGIALSLLPWVTNQKISPGGTDARFPSTSDGTLPVPFPALPWHDRQYFP